MTRPIWLYDRPSPNKVTTDRMTPIPELPITVSLYGINTIVDI